MGVQERKARERQELRQEILHAARELFIEQGYESVSMRKIAERIEYSPTTIYLHFKDKAELFECVCNDTFSRLVVQLESISAEDPVEALRAGLTAYIRFGIDHPAHYRVTFMTPVEGRCQTEHSDRQDPGDRAFGCLRNAVGACISTGRFEAADLELTSQTIWAAVHGVTALLITHGRAPWIDHEALIESLLNTIVGGLEKR
jgi:AcrR family transcriptional regulator